MMLSYEIYFLKGLIIGFIIAAPLGPIGILCARRTFADGRRAGFFSGMGAAMADVLYGFIAAFCLALVSDILVNHQFWFRLAGGIVLCILGIRTFRAIPAEPMILKTKRVYAGMFTSTFFLTLTNPMTILSLAAVYAGFGLAGIRGNIVSASVLVSGLFLGSVLWWLFLVGMYSIFHRRFNHQELLWINRVAGTIIAATGVLAFASMI